MRTILARVGSRGGSSSANLPPGPDAGAGSADRAGRRRAAARGTRRSTAIASRGSFIGGSPSRVVLGEEPDLLEGLAQVVEQRGGAGGGVVIGLALGREGLDGQVAAIAPLLDDPRDPAHVDPGAVELRADL